ncbi:MAG: hypothetical protein ACYS9X_27965 [Planctomycetota bacterium]|jgi:hypothetical protein
MMRRYIAFAVLLAAGASPSCNRNGTAPAPKNNPGGPDPIVMADPIRIVVEAEAAKIEKPFEIESDDACSGRKCVLLAERWASHGEIHPQYRTKADGRPVSAKLKLGKNPIGKALVPNGMIEVRFDVKKAGRYAFWARSWFHCGCANSFHLTIDSDAPFDKDGDGEYDKNKPISVGGDATYKRWKWRRPKRRTFDLAAGAHVIRIYNREDGIRIDQVMLAEIPGPPIDPYEPSGMEKSYP